MIRRWALYLVLSFFGNKEQPTDKNRRDPVLDRGGG